MAAEDSVVPGLANLYEALDLYRSLRGSLVNLAESPNINRLKASGIMPVADIPLQAVLDLGQYGHRIEIVVIDGSWRLAVEASGQSAPLITLTGDTTEVLGPVDAPILERAVDRGDAVGGLDLVSSKDARLTLEIMNEPGQSGVHWCMASGVVNELLTSAEWVAAASGFIGPVRQLVIDDFPSEPLIFGELAISNGHSQIEPPPTSSLDLDFIDDRVSRGRPRLPSPIMFDGNAVFASATEEVTKMLGALIGLARVLVWYWLASDLELGVPPIAVVSGARLVQFPLAVSDDAEAVRDELDLYRWAVSNSDPARLEAVEHAISLAVIGADDLAGAAGPSLRTAKSVYELSRSGAVAEALAARRTARGAVAAAAQTATGAARDAAGSVMERTIVQVAAIGGVLVAQFNGVITRAQAVGVLAGIGLLTIVLLYTSRYITVPGIRASLWAAIADLDQFRDALAADDIAAIRESRAVGQADRAVASVARASTVIYLACFVAVVAAALLLAFHSTHGGTGVGHGRS